VQWIKSFRDLSDERADSVIEIPDEGYILAGRKERYGASKTDAWLIRTDLRGNEKWTKTFSGAETDWLSSVQIDPDGNFILAGGTYSYGNGSADAWLIKVSGETATTMTMTPIPSSTLKEALINTSPSPIPTKTAAKIDIIGKTEATMTDSSETPGFEISFAVAVLLSIGILIKREK